MRCLGPGLVVLLSLPLLAQEVPCPLPREVQRRAIAQLTETDVVRGAGRARILRVTCEARDKASPRTVGIAYVVQYETNAAMEITFDPATARVLETRKLPGRLQSSEEERAEAETMIRRELGFVGAEGHLEGGFVVDPPPGTPPGRYLEFHALTRDRRGLVAEVFVDLTRNRVLAPERPEVPR